MTTQLRAEEKQVRLFEERLGHAELPVSIVSAWLNDPHSLLETTIAIPDISDWSLRHHVLQVAQTVEADANLTVLCYFRQR
jgi:hypothetical protein